MTFSRTVGQVSERNLRRALLSFETCRVAQYPLTESQPVQLPDWELYIQVPAFPGSAFGERFTPSACRFRKPHAGSALW